ncbi:MAG: transcription antitermination factor NusB [Ignavibacteriaceae bacterium]|nr:transcription antitermination factor NusB [Ignavibacteriaceae bacterium]NUM71761.1 transcription antitermination factor NusB [Ignavibacteriaceae bacterium]
MSIFYKKKKSKRRLLREKILQALYAYYFNKTDSDIVKKSFTDDIDNEEDREFFTRYLTKVILNDERFDADIEMKIFNWELERIALIDRILIKMGLAEFLSFPDIPTKVTINELIEVAKEFSTFQSGKFINGILDKILADYIKDGMIKKEGRGLVTNSFRKAVKE